MCQMFQVIAILGQRVFVGFSKANSKEKIIILKYRWLMIDRQKIEQDMLFLEKMLFPGTKTLQIGKETTIL